MAPRVLRHEDADELVEAAARRLLAQLVELQAGQETVHLCLTGGRIANQVYERFAELVPDSGLDATRLHLWWGDERFVPTTDPERHSLQSLSVLARTLPVASSQVHPMPSSDGKTDPDEAAFAYAEELGHTVFDICLLGMGTDGHVASLFAGHRAFEQPPSTAAAGVTDSPVPPAERITLTLPTVNRSQRVWLFVSGSEKAEATTLALAGEEALPAARVAGVRETLWFVDQGSAGAIPTYRCSM